MRRRTGDRAPEGLGCDRGRGSDLKRPLVTAIVVGALAYASVASAAATQIQVDDSFYSPRTPPTRPLSSGASFTWVTRALRQPPAQRPPGLHALQLGEPDAERSTSRSGPRRAPTTTTAPCTARTERRHGRRGQGPPHIRRRSHRAAVHGQLGSVGGTSATNTGNQFDVRYRVGTSATWRVWRNNTAARSGVFGQNGLPVQVMPGRTYHFQARSQKTAAPNQPSGWSPTLSVTT